MSLKTVFNNIVAKKGYHYIGEVQLIDCLIEALQLHYSKKCTVIKAHKKTVSFHDAAKKKLTRELCDIFLILKFNDHYRFSFIQNKSRINNIYFGLGTFNVDLGQHYLLTQKPNIFVKNRKSSILKHCSFETVTDYAVFYKDIYRNFDCDLSSSQRIRPTFNAWLRSGKNAKTMEHDFHKTHKHNFLGMIEGLSYLNLDDVEKLPYFGEPIYFNSLKKRSNPEEIIKHNFLCDIFKDFQESAYESVENPKWLQNIETTYTDFIEQVEDDRAACYLDVKNIVILNCENL